MRSNLYLRATAISEERDGYIDVLDYTCQMIKEGTPQLAGIGDGIVGMERVPDNPATLVDESIVDFRGQGGRTQPAYRPVMGVVGSAEDNAFSFPMQVDNDKLTRKGNCKIGTQRGKDLQGVRAALRWLPNEDLDITFTADIVDDNSEAWGNVTLKRDANINPIQRAYINNYVALDAGINADKVLAGAWYRDPRSFTTFENWADPITGETINQGEKIQNRGYSLKVAYDLTENLLVNYVGAIRELDTALTASAGLPGRGDPYDFHHQVIWQHHEQLQQEVRLEGLAFGRKLDWTLGVFYFKTDEWEMLDADNAELEWAGLLQIRHDDEFANENRSAFGHAVYSLNDSLSFSAGLRYTEESDEILFRHPPNIVDIPLIKFGDERWDWKVGADWRLNDEQMLYATVATGFRNKGFQSRPSTVGQVNDQYAPFPAEEVTSYELGFKADFFDGRVRTNIAAFYDDYDPRIVTDTTRGQCTLAGDRSAAFPYQVGPTGGPGGTQGTIDTNGDGNADICPPGTPIGDALGGPGAPIIYYLNISTPAEVQGVEFELQARPFGDMLVNFTAGWNEFKSKINTPGQTGYIHPDVLIQPEYNMSGGVQYDFALSSGAVFTPRLDWSYQGERTVGSLSAKPQPDQFVPSYSVFNGRMTYVSADKAWQASLGATNLFDKFYYYDMESGTGWGVLASPGAPRMWNFSLRRNF